MFPTLFDQVDGFGFPMWGQLSSLLSKSAVAGRLESWLQETASALETLYVCALVRNVNVSAMMVVGDAANKASRELLQRMRKRSRSQDEALVRECLSGSEAAWQEFYSRFIGLMRSVVKKRYILCKEDVEDITQSAFVSLATALNNFDYEQSLPRFVCVITERVAIDEYRKRSAARRNSEAETPDGRIGSPDGASQIASDLDLPDEQMEHAEMASCLGAALKELDASCRELLTLRYLNDLSYKEIAETVGMSENTLTVRTRRCLEKLRIKFREAERKGSSRCKSQSHRKKPVIRMTFCCLMLKVC